MLDGRNDGGRAEGEAGEFAPGPRAGGGGPKEDFTADLDDEIPF
jgi:hypothetical protein